MDYEILETIDLGSSFFLEKAKDKDSKPICRLRFGNGMSFTPWKSSGHLTIILPGARNNEILYTYFLTEPCEPFIKEKLYVSSII